VLIRVSGPGCEVHVSRRTITLAAGADIPPVWVPITPRRTGSLAIRVDVIQRDGVIASVTHLLRVVRDAVESPVARVQSWQLVPGEIGSPVDASDSSSATGDYALVSDAGSDSFPQTSGPIHPHADQNGEPGRESGYAREPEKDRRRSTGGAADLTAERAQNEPLDGVLDWLQAGEQPVSGKDDPLVGSDEFIRYEDNYETFPVDAASPPNVEHVLEPDRTPPDEPVEQPTVIGNADLPDEPTILLDQSPDDDIADQVIDDEWSEWLDDLRGDE
jgi:hypothetical protein